MVFFKVAQPLSPLKILLLDNEKFMKAKKNARKKEIEQGAVFSQLFRYAEPRDIILMIIGSLAAIFNGLAFPLTSLVFGQVTNTILSVEKSIINYGNHSKIVGTWNNVSTSKGTMTKDVPGIFSAVVDGPLDQSFLESSHSFGLIYVYVGLIVSVLVFIQNACWEIACCNQIYKLRQIFFAQTMRQDVGWYDQREDEDLTNKITDDMERMRDGLGSKVPLLFSSISLLISGLVVGFATSWKLTLVIMLGGPVLLIATAYHASESSKIALREQLRYGVAGGIASEVLTSLRTVCAFGGEKHEIERFSEAVIEGMKQTVRKYYFLAVGLALSFGLVYALYGVALWYGSVLYLDDEILAGQLFTVFMSVITGALGIGNSLPNVMQISGAIGAAATIFDIIDNVPKIDPYSDEGQNITSMQGEIEFKNVYFSYPTRPQIMVLSGLNLTIPAGKVVAIVGTSGAGKSTLVNLILRFYDPLCGKVSVDGVDISDLNIQNFRHQIGVVSQEPVLFDITIEENIRYGKPSATKAEIEEAAKIAFAHSFIESLSKGYDTMVGERGVQLSGGQKQRIAIARAIVRKPKILLLDEATSALDAHSETIVQAALENASKGRTTLIIAHRLSTIKNADIIYAMKNGQLAESGTHEELMAKKGIYCNLVLAQTKKTSEPEEKEKVEEPVDNPKEPVKRMLSFQRFTLKRLSSKVAPESKINDDEEVSYFKLMKVNESPWSLIFAIIACALSGLHIPAFAYLYGGIIEFFTLDVEEFIRQITLWIILFFVLAVFTALTLSFASLSSSSFTENMIKDLRIKTFKNILSQQLSFFDEDKYSPIQLTNSLAKEPPFVKNIAGLRAGMIIITVVSTTSSMAIAFYSGWRIALIVICFIPFLVLGNWIQMRIRFKSVVKECETTARVAKIASECLQNIKTVQFLCLQEHVLSIFTAELGRSHKDELKQGFIFAATFSVVSATVFFMYGCSFKFGAEFISDGYMSGNDLYRTIFALVLSSTQLGTTMLFFQDFGRAKGSISRVYKLMTLPSKLDVFSTEGEQPKIDGTIEFRDVHFSYPIRRHIPVLHGFSLKIPSGMTVALVGGSGCGKSTLIALLERFYNVKKGEILISGVNIEKINVNYLRSHIGLVTQEPTLFDTTIRENICYGMSSLGRAVTNQEIIDAAKAANIHEFIVNLPEGYETKVGDRGSKLSGGQKQRIAIARALLRDPKILLLDEATSALDTESERVVQEALENARQGRTSIVIAHRLSTVKSADLIAVIADGRVVEIGTHQKLLELEGHYYDLVKNQ